jgi:hypothetical protein
LTHDACPDLLHAVVRDDAESAYVARVRRLERALLAFVVWIHRTTDCGVGGVHVPQCEELFEQLGWENYEQYVMAIAEELERCTNGVT